MLFATLMCFDDLSLMCFDDLSLIRYYLKERAFHGTLVQEEEAEVRVLKATPQADNLFDVCVCVCVVSPSFYWQAIFKNSKLWESVLSLSPKQVAEELTRLVRELVTPFGRSLMFIMHSLWLACALYQNVSPPILHLPFAPSLLTHTLPEL